jgi:hypothetical protein
MQKGGVSSHGRGGYLTKDEMDLTDQLGDGRDGYPGSGSCRLGGK